MEKEKLKELVILEAELEFESTKGFATCTDRDGLLYTINGNYLSSEIEGKRKISIDESYPTEIIRESIPKFGIIARVYEPTEINLLTFDEGLEILDEALKSEYSQEWPERIVNKTIDAVIFPRMDELCQPENPLHTGVVILPKDKLEINEDAEVIKTIARAADGREYLLLWNLSKDVSRDQNGMLRPTEILGKTGIGQYRQLVDKDDFEINQDYWKDRHLFRRLTSKKLQEKRNEYRLQPQQKEENTFNITKRTGKGLER